jgi:hypothetical protein
MNVTIPQLYDADGYRVEYSEVREKILTSNNMQRAELTICLSSFVHEEKEALVKLADHILAGGKLDISQLIAGL